MTVSSVTSTELYGTRRSTRLTATSSHGIFDEIVGVVVLENFGRDFQVLRPVEAVIESIDGSFVASFNDANIHASGDTSVEALANLISLTGDLLKVLITNEDRLARGARRQLSTLLDHLRPAEC